MRSTASSGLSRGWSKEEQLGETTGELLACDCTHLAIRGHPLNDLADPIANQGLHAMASRRAKQFGGSGSGLDEVFDFGGSNQQFVERNTASKARSTAHVTAASAEQSPESVVVVRNVIRRSRRSA